MTRILEVSHATSRDGHAVVFTELRGNYRVALHLGKMGWAYAMPYADKRAFDVNRCTINGLDVVAWFAKFAPEVVHDADFMLQVLATETAKS
jgi:hypothetical protein